MKFDNTRTVIRFFILIASFFTFIYYLTQIVKYYLPDCKDDGIILFSGLFALCFSILEISLINDINEHFFLDENKIFIEPFMMDICSCSECKFIIKTSRKKKSSFKTLNLIWKFLFISFEMEQKYQNNYKVNRERLISKLKNCSCEGCSTRRNISLNKVNGRRIDDVSATPSAPLPVLVIPPSTSNVHQPSPIKHTLPESTN